MMNVIRNITTKANIKCPYAMTPTRIVVHNTANNASARNEISYMNSNDNKVSFHYAVDDKEIVQGIEENRNAWHAGDGASGTGNRQGISIEICYSKGGGDKFVKAEQNAVLLIVDILKRYGWGIDKVTKHQDYSGKYCPHRTLDMGWQRFLNMVSAELNKSAYIGQTADRNENTDQIQVNVTSLIARDKPSLNGVRKGYANLGIYNKTDVIVADGYTWYKLNNGLYAPSKDNWITELPKKAPTPIIEPIIDKPSEPILKPIEPSLPNEPPIIIEIPIVEEDKPVEGNDPKLTIWQRIIELIIKIIKILKGVKK